MAGSIAQRCARELKLCAVRCARRGAGQGGAGPAQVLEGLPVAALRGPRASVSDSQLVAACAS